VSGAANHGRNAPIPYLLGLQSVVERLEGKTGFPFELPFVRSLDLSFRSPVVFFVGENGSGKSTLLEAAAVLCGFPVSGGGRAESGSGHGPEQDSELSFVLRPSFRQRPWDGFFLRAEFEAHFASLLDARRADPDFLADPYARYGGRSLHTRSHGEAFLAILKHRLTEGLFLLDEPESALSPQRQLTMLALMHELVKGGRTQFLIATHSPILMTYPGAQIFSFDKERLQAIPLDQTSHYQITRGVLDAPERYWRHLMDEERGLFDD